MLQFRFNKYILLLLVTPVLLTAPVYAQENQPATQAGEVTMKPSQSAANASSASLTKREQKKQLALVKNKLIADKEKLCAKELKPVSTASSNAAEQEKPAEPAAGGDDTAELAKKPTR